eukprot:3857580-Rhodomonas_salina.1
MFCRDDSSPPGTVTPSPRGHSPGYALRGRKRMAQDCQCPGCCRGQSLRLSELSEEGSLRQATQAQNGRVHRGNEDGCTRRDGVRRDGTCVASRDLSPKTAALTDPRPAESSPPQARGSLLASASQPQAAQS